MDVSERKAVRDFVDDLLRDVDDAGAYADTDSLFGSGRLDSLSAVRLVAFLEHSFAIDFDANEFAIERIDSIEAIGALVDEVRR